MLCQANQNDTQKLYNALLAYNKLCKIRKFDLKDDKEQYKQNEA